MIVVRYLNSQIILAFPGIFLQKHAIIINNNYTYSTIIINPMPDHHCVSLSGAQITINLLSWCTTPKNSGIPQKTSSPIACCLELFPILDNPSDKFFPKILIIHPFNNYVICHMAIIGIKN
jgi:hypothetical protein